jgi:sucrose synthase
VSTTLDDLTRPHRSALYLLMRRLVELDKPLLVRSEIVETFEDVAAAAEGVDLGSSDLAALLRSAQEGVVRAPFLYLAVRTRIARWRYLQLTLDDAFLREVPVSEYLRVKDAIIEGDGEGDRWSLEVLGFEPGWGDDAERVRETMELLLDILEAPSPQAWSASWRASR